MAKLQLIRIRNRRIPPLKYLSTMEKFNINEWTNSYSSDQLRVDENGVTGYISETPALKLGGMTMPTREEMRTGLLEWQDYAFSKGLTAVSDALVSAGTVDPDIYVDLATDPDKPWKLRPFCTRYEPVSRQND